MIFFIVLNNLKLFYLYFLSQNQEQSLQQWSQKLLAFFFHVRCTCGSAWSTVTANGSSFCCLWNTYSSSHAIIPVYQSQHFHPLQLWASSPEKLARIEVPVLELEKCYLTITSQNKSAKRTALPAPVPLLKGILHVKCAELIGFYSATLQ